MIAGIMLKGCDCMMNKALKMTLLYFAVFASALMIITLVITSIVKGTPAATPAVFTQTQSDNSYWLRPYNGCIAVYSNKEDKFPVIETTIDVEGLRAVDKEKIEKGIEAQSYEDVLKLLEDFGS